MNSAIEFACVCVRVKESRTLISVPASPAFLFREVRDEENERAEEEEEEEEVLSSSLSCACVSASDSCLEYSISVISTI